MYKSDWKETATIQFNRFMFNSICNVNLAEDLILDKRIYVNKLNNPDGSDLAVMSGIVDLSEINHNEPVSFQLK